MITAAELPGGGWVLPVRDDQIGRVAKAFVATHDVPCPGAPRRVFPVSRAVDATFSSRLGRGLSIAGSVVVTYAAEGTAAARFGTAVSQRIAGCFARGMTGTASGATVEAWVAPSPLAGVAPLARAARVAVAYSAPGEGWRGALDLVEVRVRRSWGFYVLFASAAPRAARAERRLVGAAVDRLQAARSTQSRSVARGETALDWRDAAQRSVEQDTSALALVTAGCPLPGDALVQALANLGEAQRLATEASAAVEASKFGELAQRDLQVTSKLASNDCAIVTGGRRIPVTTYLASVIAAKQAVLAASG